MSITTPPEPIKIATTMPVDNNIDRAPAPVRPGVGTGYIYTVPQPVVPVFEQPVLYPPIPSTPTPIVIPVGEQPVDVAGTAESTTGGPNIIPNRQRYITILSNGTLVNDNTSFLDFVGDGFTLTKVGTSGANISVNAGAGGYGNSDVVNLLADFGSNTISTEGNITASYFVGNGSLLTGISGGSSYGNANVVSLLANFGSNTIQTTGNATVGSLTATGNITVVNGIFSGNGAGLTGVVAVGNVGSASQLANGTSSFNIPVANGNVVGNIGGVTNVYQFASTGLTVAGIVSATGNVTGNYFVGNGSLLTGISGGSSYSNANVVTLLAGFGSNTISTTGNVTAGYFIGTLVGNTIGTGAGTPTVSSATNLDLSATAAVRVVGGGTFRLPTLTTAQIANLIAANGDMVYNSTTSKIQARANGVWGNITLT